MSKLHEVYQELFEEVRKLHNRLRWTGDVLHEQSGVSTAMRSLLFSLHREGPCTVPELARERLVSRQIIQTQINGLLDLGLVASRKNPRHQRSSHVVLTGKGKQMVKEMLKQEEALLEKAGSPLSSGEVEGSVRSLRTLREHLEKLEFRP